MIFLSFVESIEMIVYNNGQIKDFLKIFVHPVANYYRLFVHRMKGVREREAYRK